MKQKNTKLKAYQMTPMVWGLIYKALRRIHVGRLLTEDKANKYADIFRFIKHCVPAREVRTALPTPVSLYKSQSTRNAAQLLRASRNAPYLPINSQRNTHSFWLTAWRRSQEMMTEQLKKTFHTMSDCGSFGKVETNHIVWWMQFEPE